MDTSPTGTPLIPPRAVPFISAGLVIAGALAQVVPQQTVAGRVLSLITSILGPLFGVLSPGLRKKPE